MRQLVIVFILALILTGGASFLIGRTSVGSIIQTEIVEVPVEIPGPEIIREVEIPGPEIIREIPGPEIIVEVPGPERVVRRNIIIEVAASDSADKRFEGMNAFFSIRYAFGTPRGVVGSRLDVTDADLPLIVSSSIHEASEAVVVWAAKCDIRGIPTNIQPFFDPNSQRPANCARAPAIMSWVSLDEAIRLQEILGLEPGVEDPAVHPFTRVSLIYEREILYQDTAYYAQLVTWWEVTEASVNLVTKDESERPRVVEVIPSSLLDVHPLLSEMLEAGDFPATRNISTAEYVSLATSMSRFLDWPSSLWLPNLAEGFVQNEDEFRLSTNGVVVFFMHNDVKYSLELVPTWKPILLG